MNNDTHDKVTAVAQQLSRYEIEELESRFEMVGFGNSQCSSSCGTEAK